MCPVCGSEVRSFSPNAVYCGRSCRVEADTRRRRAARPAAQPDTCRTCGESFDRSGVRPRRHFCSDSCREVSNAEKKARRPAPTPDLDLDEDEDRPDLFAQGWAEGRMDTLRDLRTHLPHDGDPCELCNVLADVLKALQGARYRAVGCPDGQVSAIGPRGYRL